MGLDMYVTAKRYLWDFGDSNDKDIADAIGKLFPEIKGSRVKQVEVEAMYWRKANAIHKWFVDNVQDGIDECQESFIAPEKLYELRDTCKKVLEDRDLAPTLLPAKSGFFFGGTDYDEGYFDDVECTLDWLNDLLVKNAFSDDHKQWSFYYRASW